MRNKRVTIGSCDNIYDWSSWISSNTDEETIVEDDFGLLNIAEQLGKEDAVKMY